MVGLVLWGVGVSAGAAAVVDDPPPEEGTITGVAQGGTIDVEGVRERAFREQVREASVSPAAGGNRSSGPITLERYVYACAGNTYAGDPAVNVPCEESFQFCPAGPAALRQFYRYTTTITGVEVIPGPGAGWVLNGVLCLPTDAGDPAAAEAAPIPVVTLADFRSLPLPAGEPTIQPGGGEALIRARTNVFVDPASTEVQTFDITLLATPVTVRATPVSYAWDFGDGSAPLVTEDPGAPYPDLTTWHEYSEPGDVAISLTTTYTGEYSVAGGPFTDIPGTAEIASEPVGLELVSTTNRLTD